MPWSTPCTASRTRRNASLSTSIVATVAEPSAAGCRSPRLGAGYLARMGNDEERDEARAGITRHPSADETTAPETEVGSTASGSPVEDVEATGTALHKGERTSDLDLDDAPGTAGPGAG
jgi:hypothetical protein